MYTYNTSPQENIEIAKLRIGDTSLQEYINSAQAIVSSSPSSLISRIDGSNASLNIQVADANPNYSKGQVVGDTLGMLAKDIFNGLSKAFEGIADFGAGLAGTIAGAVGDKSTEQVLADYVARDTTNEYVWNGMFKGTNQDFEASAINRLSETGQNIVRGTAQAVGGMIPTIAISLISRGAGASAAVASVASLAQMGVSAAGNATEEALNDVIGYDENGNEIHTTLDRAFLYGLANGAMEIATETLIGGVYEGIFGKGLLDGVVKRLVKNIKFGKIVAWLINVFGEGVEEIVGAVFDDTLRTIYNSADGKMHWKAPDLQAVIENGIIGSLTAVVMGGAQSALSRVSTKNTIGMSLQNINENNEWATNLQNKGRFDETRASNYQTDNEKQLKTIEKRLKMMSEARRAKIMSEMPQLSNYFDENGTRLEKQKLNANAAELGDLTTARQNGTYDARITDDNVVANRFGQSQQQLLERNNAKVQFTIAEDLTAEERKRYNELQKLGKNTGAKTGKPLKYVVFQADIQNQNETDLRIVNGFVIDDIMYINRENLADISKVSPEAKVWAHENAHYAEGTPEYDLLMSILQTSYPELYKQVRANVESPSSPYAAYPQEIKEKEINAILLEEVFSQETTKDANGKEILGNEYLKERIIADNSGFFAKLANRIKWTAKALKAAFSGDKATLQYIHQLELIARVIENTIEAGGTKLLKTRAYNRDKEDTEAETNAKDNVELAPQFSKSFKFKDNVFPSRKESKGADANQLAILWAKEEDTKSGDQKLQYYNGDWYVIEAFDDMPLGYQIVEKISKKDYNRIVEEIESYKGEKYARSIDEGISIYENGYAEQSANNDETNRGQDDRSISQMAKKRDARESSGIETKRNSKTGDNNIQYSLEIGDETIDVEAEKKSNLVALHNLDEKALLKVLELGGFAMPSIAITKADFSHDAYGKITIIFDKKTIDPKASSKNKVYSLDAWTPTIPTIEIKLNREKAKGFNDYIQSLVNKYPEYRNYTGWLDNRYKNYAGDFVIKEYDFNADSMYYNAIDDAPTMAAYLSTKKGKDIKPVYREKYYSTHGFSQVSRSEAKRIIETLGIKNPVDYNNMSSEEKQKLLDKYILYKAKQLQEQLNAKESDQPKITYEQALNHYKREYDIGKINDLLFMANDYFNDTDDQKYDLYATKDKLKAQIDDKEDFKNWIWDKIKDAYEKKGIRNNNSASTSSGNWRKFESLHDEYTLDNLVNQMLKSGELVGKPTMFGYSIGAFAAKLAKQFTSIKDIKSAKNLITENSSKEWTDVEQSFNDKAIDMLQEIENDIRGDYEAKYVDEELRRKEDIEDILAKCADAKALSVDRIKAIYKRETDGYDYLHFTFNDEIAEKIVTFFQFLQTKPASYFEAKPRRAIPTSEIKYIIIPDSSSQELIDKLDAYNIPYYKYNGQDGERSKIISQMDDIKFSLSSSRDSDGMRLTNGQVDYFKDSKVRDENGNLLAVYHGTDQSPFTIFGETRNKAQFGVYKFGDYNVNFFTKNKDIAEGYTELGYDNGNNIYKVYLDIKKPYTIESSKGDEWSKSWKDIQDENLKKLQDEIYKDFRKKWLNKTNIKDKNLDEINKTLVLLGYEIHPSIERPSQYDDKGYDKRVNEYDVYYAPNNTLQGGTIAEYSYTLEDLFEKDGILDERLSEDFSGERFLTSDDVVRLVLFMNENKKTDYDGIIIKDIRDIGSKGGIFDGNTDDYITIKASNQIKAVDNLNPTEHDDIQMSLVGMHWGDLNYGKKADTRDRMGGRGTGHFGTGFYFVSKDNYGDMNYDYDEARPIFEIDLNPYNLFKPRTNDEAYRLHDGLKDVNDAAQFIDDLYFNEDVALRELDDIYDNYNREDLIKELIKFADKNGITRYVEFMYNYAVNGESLNEVLNWVINETTYRDVELYKQVKDAIEWKARKTSYLESSIRSLSGILGVDAEQLKTLIKRADYISQETNNSTSTELMKLLGYEGVGVYHLTTDDAETWTASPDNFTYGSVLYDLKPNTYKMTRGKIYYEMPYNVEKLYEKEFDGYKVKKVNIKEVIDKNNMLSNDNIFNRRRDVWGNNIDDYHIDTDKLVDDMSIYSPIRLRADYKVVDGNHRLLAMYNDGYQFADVLVENEKGFEARQKVEKQIDEMLSHPVEEEDIPFSLVNDKKLLDKLEKSETIKVYRAMQIVNGKLYSPMAAKINGKWTQPTELGKWYQADEHPELIKNGKFKLDKGNQSSIYAAYNPYWHTSNSMLNDQFASAYKRPNLVVVESEIPKWDLDEHYHADKAKDSTGMVEWKGGIVDNQLPKEKQRKVYLSRYNKVLRIVPDSEVAKNIKEQIGKVEIPYNVVTPSLREELQKVGYQFSNEDEIRFSLKSNYDSDGNELSTQQKNYFKDTKVVDDKGNLQVVYHGTEESFTIFDKSLSDNSFFFSNNRYVASSYGDRIMPVYLDIKKPYIIDAYNSNWDEILDTNRKEFRNYEAMQDYLAANYELKEFKEWNGQFPKGARDMVKKIFGWTIKPVSEYDAETQKEVKELEEDLSDEMNKVTLNFAVVREDKDGFIWDTWYVDGIAEFMWTLRNDDNIFKYERTRQIVYRARNSKEYDGVIFKNLIDYGSFELDPKPSDIYVVFEPNQIKSTLNRNPTEDDDIRFSLSNQDLSKGAVTDSPYEVYNLLTNKSKPYRILYDKNIDKYMIGNAYDVTHFEMLENAIKQGYYAGNKQYQKIMKKMGYNINDPREMYASRYNYFDNGIDGDEENNVDPYLVVMTYAPTEDDIKSAIMDGYDTQYGGENGTILTRDTNFKDSPLSNIWNKNDIQFSMSNDNRPIINKTKKDVEKAANNIFFYDERNHKDMFGVLSKEEAANIAREIVKVAPTIPANMIDKFCDDIADDIVERASYDDERLFAGEMHDIKDLKAKKKAANKYVHKIKFSDSNKQEIKFRMDKDGYMNVMRKYSAKEGGTPLDVILEEMYEAIGEKMPEQFNENDMFFDWLGYIDELDRALSLSEEEVRGRYTKTESNMTEEQKDAIKENIRERLVDALTPIVDNAKLVKENILAEEKGKLQEKLDKKYNEKVEQLKEKAQEEKQKNKERLDELIEQARNTAAKSVEKKTKDILENTQKVVDRAHEDVLKVKEENSLMKKKFRALKSITKKAVFFRKESLKKYPDSSMLGDEGVEQAISVLSRLAAYGYAGSKAGRQIIADYIAKFYNPDNERIADWFDKDLYDDLVEIANNRTKTTKSGKVMNNGSDLSYEEIKVIEKMIRNAELIVKTYNKLLIDGQYQDIDEKARQAVGTMKKYKAMMSDAKMARIFRVFVANSIEPRVVIKWLFGMQENVLSELYEDIAKGETKAQAATLHFARMLQEFYKNHKKYGKTLSKKITFRGHKMTKAQLLTLIKYFEQEHSRQAVETTGWAIKNEKTKNYELADGLIDTDSLISEEELVDLTSRFDGQQLEEEIDNLKAKHKEERVKAASQEMYDLLTEEDKAYLELISNIMEEAAKLQIETDILFKGYSDINPETARHYLPIRRYGMDRAIDSFKAVVDSMKVDQAGNQSISKQRVKNAKRLELLDIDALALDYFHKLGVYYGLAVPIKEFQRAYNFNTSHNMNKPISIRNTIVQDVWAYANEYIQKLLGDIQGFDRGKSIGSKTLSKLRSAYVVASLGLNIKVMLTQFASYPTAFSILRASSLAKAFTRRVSFKEMDKYSEYADVRNALGDATRAEGADNTQNKIARAMMFMIQKVDRFTIGMIWNACQFEVESKHKGDATYKFGTEENKKEAAELLEQVSRRTQPNYTTTERTGIQRSNSEIVRWTLGSFTSVPSKMLSRLVESSLELRALWYKEHKLHEKVSPEERKAVGQKFIKSVTAVTMSNLMYVLIAQAMKFAMDKDRKKDKDGNEVSWWEDMLIDFGGVSAGMIPMFKDLYQTFVQGYDFDGETFSTSAISDLIDLSQDFVNLVVDTADGKAFSTNKMNGLIRNLAYALSTMTGIPLKNVYNQLYGFVKRFDPSAAYQMNSVFYSTSNYSKDLKKAVEDGDTDLANTIMGLMLKDKGITKLSDKVTDKIRSLYEKGFNVLPRTIGDSVTIDGETYPLSVAQQKQIKSVYDEANAKVEKLIDGKGFNSLDEKVQAKAIKWIYDYYYEYAVAKTLGLTADSKKLLYGETMSVERFALAISVCSSLTSDIDKKGNKIANSKKNKIIATLRQAGMSRAEREMVLAYLGYSVDETIITRYIRSLGLSRNQQKIFKSYVSFAAAA